MIKFRIQKLTEIIENVYQLCHIKVSVFDEDFNEILYYPEKYNSFCALIRQNPKGNERCFKADTARLEEVKQTLEAKTYICPHGLIEVFSPIIADDKLVGFLTLGQMLPESYSLEEIFEKTAYLNIDQNIIKESLEGLEKITEPHIKASTFLVNICARFIYLDNSIDIYNDEMIDEIKQYINEHIDEKITVENICEHFYLSRVSLYYLFNTYLESTVADYIRKQKLVFAKKIIEHNLNMSINDVADKIGMDYNYFSKVFFKEYHVTPKKYQIQVRSFK